MPVPTILFFCSRSTCAPRQGLSLLHKSRSALPTPRLDLSVRPSKSGYEIASIRMLHNTLNYNRLNIRWPGSFCNRNTNLSSMRTTPLLQPGRWIGTNKSPEEGKKPSENSIQNTLKPKSRLLSRLPVAIHENIYTVPNILTFSRLIAAPVVGYLLIHNYHAVALSLFAYAGITDLIDGYIARRYNLQTVVGTIIDPAADKLLMTISVVCLALNGSMPVWLAVLILGRDVGLSISAIYYRWISLPPPKTMARYWDFSLPSAEVKPTGISKINTALQLLLVGSSMALPVVPDWLTGGWSLYDGLIGLQYLVAATTIWSGLSYVFSKNAVKILTDKEIKERLSRVAASRKNH